MSLLNPPSVHEYCLSFQYNFLHITYSYLISLSDSSNICVSSKYCSIKWFFSWHYFCLAFSYVSLFWIKVNIVYKITETEVHDIQCLTCWASGSKYIHPISFIFPHISAYFIVLHLRLSVWFTNMTVFTLPRFSHCYYRNMYIYIIYF